MSRKSIQMMNHKAVLEDYERYTGLDGYRILASMAREREIFEAGMGSDEIRAALIADDAERAK